MLGNSSSKQNKSYEPCIQVYFKARGLRQAQKKAKEKQKLYTQLKDVKNRIREYTHGYENTEKR